MRVQLRIDIASDILKILPNLHEPLGKRNLKKNFKYNE